MGIVENRREAIRKICGAAKCGRMRGRKCVPDVLRPTVGESIKNCRSSAVNIFWIREMRLARLKICERIFKYFWNVRIIYEFDIRLSLVNDLSKI